MNNLVRWQGTELPFWPGFSRLTTLRDEIDRLFEVPLAGLARSSQLLSGWTPVLDVYEDGNNVYVRAEVGGMRKEEINISIHNGSLSISGERKAEEQLKNAEIYRAERFFGQFQRTIALPTPVSVDQVKAQYKDGILNITLPKAEEAKPKHIDVNVN